MANDKPNPSAPSAPADPVKSAAAAAASAAVEAMLPTIAAMLNTKSAATQGVGRAIHDPGPQCPICGQYIKACGGPSPEGEKDVNHIMLAVYPQGIAAQAEFAAWFQGVTINGVKYLSNGPGHRIPVPKHAAADIKATVTKWSDEEVLLRVGRKVKVDKYNPVSRGDDVNSYV